MLMNLLVHTRRSPYLVLSAILESNAKLKPSSNSVPRTTFKLNKIQLDQVIPRKHYLSSNALLILVTFLVEQWSTLHNFEYPTVVLVTPKS